MGFAVCCGGWVHGYMEVVVVLGTGFGLHSFGLVMCKVGVDMCVCVHTVCRVYSAAVSY